MLERGSIRHAGSKRGSWLTVTSLCWLKMYAVTFLILRNWLVNCLNFEWEIAAFLLRMLTTWVIIWSRVLTTVVPHILNELTHLRFKNKTERINQPTARSWSLKIKRASCMECREHSAGVRRYVRKMKPFLWPPSHPKETNKQNVVSLLWAHTSQ